MLRNIHSYGSINILMFACLSWLYNSTIQGAAFPETGQIIIKNNSQYPIIVQKLNAQNQQIGASFRIADGGSETIAANLKELRTEGVESLRYGHSSDQYAGRTSIKIYSENPGNVRYASLADPKLGHSANKNIIINIPEPSYVGGLLTGSYTWMPVLIELQSEQAPKTMPTYGDIYEIPPFTSIAKVAKELKYFGSSGTIDAQMLKSKDPVRWACLMLGFHKDDFIKLEPDQKIKELEKKFIQRYKFCKNAKKTGQITEQLFDQANDDIQSAVEILLHYVDPREVAGLLFSWQAEITPLKEVSAPQQQQAPAAAGQEECAICYAPLSSMRTVSTSCGHTFHEACLLEWMKRQNTCPLCRHIITKRNIRQ